MLNQPHTYINTAYQYKKRKKRRGVGGVSPPHPRIFHPKNGTKKISKKN